MKSKTEAEAKEYDVAGAMMEYEEGGMGEVRTVELFQHLIDTGMAWSLQGHYGRMATRLIEQGVCHRKGAGE